MKVRTYRAYTMSEAVTAAELDLGVDWRMLGTRTLRRGFMGLLGRPVVEVTAQSSSVDLEHDRARTRAAARAILDRLADRAGVDRSATPVADLDLHGELSDLRSMVRTLLQRRSASAPSLPDVAPGLFDTFLELIGQDLSETLAEQVLASVGTSLGMVEDLDDTVLRSAVARALARIIPVAEPVPASPLPGGRPRTIMLVGPTGVGKTTTIAKIAARYRMHHGMEVGLMTADTYRVAAVDQLRVYADIIGVPLEVAADPGDTTRALAALGDCDMVLVDTAGRSQNDAHRLEVLRDHVREARPSETHLVLSATASEKVLRQEAEAFSIVEPDRLTLTKLDEAVSFGTLVNAVHDIGRPLGFLTTGQEVPDHLEPACADRLAGLVLGERVR